MVTGPFGNALSFDGTGHLALDIAGGSCIADPTTCSNGWTFAMWVKPAVVNMVSFADQYYLTNGGHIMGCNGVFMRSDGFTGEFVIGYQENGYLLEVGFKLEGDKWTYVLFTYDSSAGLDLYINGAMLMSGQNYTILNYTTTGICPSNTVMLAGTDNPVNEGSGANAFGAIDQFAFWDQSLCQNSIVAGMIYTHHSDLVL